MFDIGWPEMLVVAVVLIVIVGPKDLPRMLRAFGRTTSKMRSMAGDFRKQFDEALKEAELDDVKSTLDSARKLNPTSEIKKALNPMEKAAADVRAGLDDMMKPKPAKTAAPDAEAAPAEPAKAGPTAMPGAAAAKPAATVPGKRKTAAKSTAATGAAAKAKPAGKAAASPAKKTAAGARAKPAAKTSKPRPATRKAPAKKTGASS
ncbi:MULTISPECIES: Sec-independent protein translocase protein TatB [Nitratireductor]|uniref:Sec-independent protein translocase protein TatB n=1 Tax=Nitratireductor TaxID=245876 RepID=UPI000D0CECED|nr:MULTISPECIES: Sec-independent protein translocase protein TatB [Nitratireductor]PSM19594.1 twin-arginine translocase subunit TatB [Nitratireductor sp. StC3]